VHLYTELAVALSTYSHMNMIENSTKSVRLSMAVGMPVGLLPLEISNPMDPFP